MCLAGAVVTSWSQTQEVTGSNTFKDPVSHMCLAGAVVASWSLTQKVAGSIPFKHKYLVTHLRKTPVSLKSTPLRNFKFYSPVTHMFSFPHG